MSIVNYVASIGPNCAASWFCKRYLNVKRFSGPFDWIYSDPDVVTDCIENDFSKFLDVEEYTDHTYHGNGPHIAGHKTYGGKTFEHHDPRLRHHYEYFARCVQRFRKVLDSSAPKLFVYLDLNSAPPEDKSIFERLHDMLEKRTSNFTLLLIFHSISDTPHSIRIEPDWSSKQNIVVASLQTTDGYCNSELVDTSESVKMIIFLNQYFTFDLLNL